MLVTCAVEQRVHPVAVTGREPLWPPAQHIWNLARFPLYTSAAHLLSGTTLVNIVCCSSAVGLRPAGGVGLTSGAGTMAGRSTSLGMRCRRVGVGNQPD